MLEYLIDNNILNINKNLQIYFQNLPKNHLILLINKINEIRQKGIIYTSGVGKSENIAINFSNLLKSISIKSFYLNCMNSLHGDIGTIDNNDMIILFSNSGNTEELINIITNLKYRKCFITSILCNKDSKLEKISDFSLILNYYSELPNSINKLPTNSLLIQNITCNIIISCLTDIINIDKDQYKLNHQKGSIGNSLKKIKDIIKFDIPKLILEDKIALNLILLEMTKFSIGCIFFINNENKYIGLLTDGDIRRLLINNKNLNSICLNNINKKSYTEKDTNKYLYEIENIKKKKFIPILTEKNNLLGIISYKDF